MPIYPPLLIHLAEDRARELRRAAKSQRLNQTRYPDRERQPRILFHWTNRT